MIGVMRKPSMDSIDRCIEMNRKAIRALIAASNGCRAAVEVHVRMRDAKLEAEQLAALACESD
jgi:hypothetical protein